MLVIQILSIAFLVWGYRHARKAYYAAVADVLEVQKNVLAAENSYKEARERLLLAEKDFKDAMQTVQQNRELEKQMLMDTMANESRALAVVSRLLHDQGCSTEQIESVVQEIRGGAGQTGPSKYW